MQDARHRCAALSADDCKQQKVLLGRILDLLTQLAPRGRAVREESGAYRGRPFDTDADTDSMVDDAQADKLFSLSLQRYLLLHRSGTMTHWLHLAGWYRAMDLTTPNWSSRRRSSPGACDPKPT